MDFMKRYDRITRKVFVDVEGREYALLFTLQGLTQLEAVSGQPIMAMTGNGNVPSLTLLVEAFKIGLMGVKNNQLQEAKCPAIAEQYLQIYGFEGMVNLFFALLATSGLLGPKRSNDILTKLGVSPLDKVDDVKNEEQAKQ